MTDDAQYRLDPHPGADTLVAAFTSYGADGAPAKGFEWVEPLRPFACHKLFLRDERQHWYLSGVEGFSTSIDDTAARIRETAAEVGASRIVTLGSSMGAYAAIYVGILLKCPQVLTFAANTNVELDWVLAHADGRTLPKIMEIAEIGYPNRDLRPMMQAATAPPEILVYYGEDDGPTRRYGAYVADLPIVRCFPLKGVGHDVARQIARAGGMSALLAALVGSPPQQ